MKLTRHIRSAKTHLRMPTAGTSTYANRCTKSILQSRSRQSVFPEADLHRLIYCNWSTEVDRRIFISDQLVSSLHYIQQTWGHYVSCRISTSIPKSTTIASQPLTQKDELQTAVPLFFTRDTLNVRIRRWAIIAVSCIGFIRGNVVGYRITTCGDRNHPISDPPRSHSKGLHNLVAAAKLNWYLHAHVVRKSGFLII